MATASTDAHKAIHKRVDRLQEATSLLLEIGRQSLKEARSSGWSAPPLWTDQEWSAMQMIDGDQWDVLHPVRV